MAKIPIVQVESTLPAVRRRSGEARVWRAVEGLGYEGQRLGFTLARQEGDLRRKKKALDMALTLGEFDVDVTSGLENLKTELRRSPDPETYYSDWEKRSATIIGRELAKIEDPETRARAEVQAKRIQVQEVVEQKHYANLLWGNEKLATAGKVLTNYQRTGELEKGIELIDELERNGLVNAVKAEEWRQSHKDKVEINRIRELNPEDALRRLGAGEWNLDPDDRVALTREIRAEIAYQERQERKRVEEQRDAVEKDFFAKLHAETLQPGEIIASNLSLTVKDYFMNALEMKKAPKTDGATFHKLFVGIQEGIRGPDGKVRPVESKDFLKAYNAEKLSVAHMSQLLGRFYRIKEGYDPEGDWWYKLIRKEAEQRLDYQGDIARFLNPEGADHFFTGMATLMDAIEKEGITGRKIYERGQEIFTPFYVDYGLGELLKTEDIYESLPPASEHKGQTMEDTDTGKRYKSDGEKWTEVK